jgi:hypothetical protein
MEGNHKKGQPLSGDLIRSACQLYLGTFLIGEGNASVTLPRSYMSLEVPSIMFSRGSMILDFTIEDLEKEEKCLKPHKMAVPSVPRHSKIVAPLLLTSARGSRM